MGAYATSRLARSLALMRGEDVDVLPGGGGVFGSSTGCTAVSTRTSSMNDVEPATDMTRSHDVVGSGKGRGGGGRGEDRELVVMASVSASSSSSAAAAGDAVLQSRQSSAYVMQPVAVVYTVVESEAGEVRAEVLNVAHSGLFSLDADTSTQCLLVLATTNAMHCFIGRRAPRAHAARLQRLVTQLRAWRGAAVLGVVVDGTKQMSKAGRLGNSQSAFVRELARAGAVPTNPWTGGGGGKSGGDGRSGEPASKKLATLSVDAEAVVAENRLGRRVSFSGSLLSPAGGAAAAELPPPPPPPPPVAAGGAGVGEKFGQGGTGEFNPGASDVLTLPVVVSNSRQTPYSSTAMTSQGTIGSAGMATLDSSDLFSSTPPPDIVPLEVGPARTRARAQSGSNGCCCVVM